MTYIAFSRSPLGLGTVFFYYNVNYAILGAVAEALAETSYQKACAVPGARLSAKTGAFASWGGWEMAAEDYARFADRTFNDGTFLRRAPRVKIEKNVFYGPGMTWSDTQMGALFWHHGGVCFPLGLKVGSFVIGLEREWTVVTGCDGCISNAKRADLESVLLKAMLQ